MGHAAQPPPRAAPVLGQGVERGPGGEAGQAAALTGPPREESRDLGLPAPSTPLPAVDPPPRGGRDPSSPHPVPLS